MNRFRTKKKAKEIGDEVARGSTDSDGPPPVARAATNIWGRKKAPEPEPVPEIDLTTALPSSDDFRTSLLMSGLSARFSMLREQDDPHSKIGKASDDSVLLPKRQSRFNDFNFNSNGLSDIAEVSSINGSIRPPFAFSRTGSYGGSGEFGSDTDSTHGSIMNRSKPGESNNLFGGRQKISMGNRTLYDNDVSQSAYQKLKIQEREQRDLERQERDDSEAQQSRPSSPLTGYNRNRETSSTTSSTGPGRMSTAATSFTSQRTPSLNGGHTPTTPGVPSAGNLERSATKTRRLYETGTDNHLHEQQHSALSRIESLTRQRALGGISPPAMSPTFNNINGPKPWGGKQLGAQASMPNLRANSPSPTGPPMSTFDFGVKPANGPQPHGVVSPPLSPPGSDFDERTALPLRPIDVGKATALGAFTKPLQTYDESKYTQRQLQMQQGQQTPPPRKQSPGGFVSRQQQQLEARNRAASNATFASGSSRSNSSAQRHFPPTDRLPDPPRTKIIVPTEQVKGTFLISPNGSSVASPNDEAVEPPKLRVHPKPLDLSSIYRPGQNIKLERPPESQHPAHRQQPFTSESQSSPSVSTSTSTMQPSTAASTEPPADSPTLGPITGLSGLVRAHMRSDSDSSSIYGSVPSAQLTSRFPADATGGMPRDDYGARSPWEGDDWDQGYYGDNKLEGNALNDAVPSPLAVRSPNIDSAEPRKASWERELEAHHARNGSTETQKERQDFKAELASRRKQVQENLKSFVETDSRSTSPLPGADYPQHSVLAKSNALGLLKPKTSMGSLAGRPKEGGTSKAMKMLGLGNATMNSNINSQPSASPRRENFEANSWKREEEETFRGVPSPSSPRQNRTFQQQRRDARRDREHDIAMRHPSQKEVAPERSDFQNRVEPKRRTDNQNGMDNRVGSQGQPYNRGPIGPPPSGPPPQARHRDPSRERKHPPPVTYSHRNGNGGSQQSKDSTGTSSSEYSRPPSRVSRSGSETSGGRSKSRNGRYKDDLAKAMAEGTSSSNQGAFEDFDHSSARLMPKSPASFAQPSPAVSPMIGTNQRSRSNSKSTPAGYFDPSKLPMGAPAEQFPTMEIGGLPPRPSPTAPFVANPTPALSQPSPNSGTVTPNGSQYSQTPVGAPAVRKRSINKSEISEPKFLSSTSRVNTVNLPPGASLQNGLDLNAPPIPPVNPKRRQTRTMFGAIIGRKIDDEDVHSLPLATQSTEEMSTFSGDEGDSKPRVRGKLRKSSSEGGNLNARARQAAGAAPSPAMPGTFPSGSGSPPRPVEGGMF